MSRQLTLLGTIHSDPQGMRRLYRAIREINPETITFEWDTESYGGFLPLVRELWSEQLAKRFGFCAQQREELEEILKAYGYEWKIAKGLELVNEFKIHYIDENREEDPGGFVVIPDTAQKPEVIRQYQQLFSTFYSRLREITSPTEREVIAIACAQVLFDPAERETILNYQYNHSLDEAKVIVLPENISRDQTMKQRIREIWKNTEGDLLHVGGLYHTHGQYHNLYERLKDLQPQRRKLNEF